MPYENLVVTCLKFHLTLIKSFLQENLHIVIRFRNNKVLEFDADTAEEKYTICRLLGIVLNPEPVETNGKSRM